MGVVQGAMAVASEEPAYRNGWERYGARYFKAVLKIKEGGGKDRNVELQVEVNVPTHSSLTFILWAQCLLGYAKMSIVVSYGTCQ